jgi:hypothetical protein
MSEEEKTHAKKILEAVETIETEFNKEISKERSKAKSAKTDEGTNYHVAREIEFGNGKAGLLKLKAKFLSNERSI